MAMDFNAARLIVEAAKKRGAIQAPGEPKVPAEPESKPKESSTTVLPDWLREDTSRDSRRW
jgi:hypothetical protein